jgi:2-phospho-L-lactate guanylyltransferase
VPWTVVIPVKSAEVGKSRLGRSPDVVQAIALDTIAAAVAAGDVRVIVVTSDADLAAEASSLGADVVREDSPAGLDHAIDLGLARVTGARAVLLGDLPALRPADLAEALAAAAGHARAFVPDAEGTGSTLVTAAAGEPFVHNFGTSSADRHRAAGLAEVALPADSPLRRDVDLAEHLDAAAVAGLGARTRAALDRDA